jgi:hypothetical protein
MTDLLEQRFTSATNPIDDSDWLDVRRRARRLGPTRKRIVLAAAAAVLAAVVVTPAFGIGSRLLDLIGGSPAPPRVQTYFAQSDALRARLFAYAAAAGQQLRERFSPVVPGSARGVAAIDSVDGPIYLWAAATEDGRQCWLIQAGEDAATRRPYGFGACDDEHPSGRIVPGTYWTDERPNVQILHVRVYDDSVTHVSVDLYDGEAVSLPVASGHALGVIAMGLRVKEFEARNADGDVVARAAAP